MILVSIFMVTGIFFFSCKGDIKVIQELGEEDTAPFQTVMSGNYTFTDSGRVRNILSAGQLEQYTHDTDYTKVSEGLNLEIYDRNEQLAGVLQSENGIYFKKQNRMEATDNVVFTNPKGDSLFTEHLIWLSDSHLIKTNEKVRIIRDGNEIRGQGMRANEDFSRYTILAPAGDIVVPENLSQDEHSNNK